jgi:hypothetical protein
LYIRPQNKKCLIHRKNVVPTPTGCQDADECGCRPTASPARPDLDGRNKTGTFRRAVISARRRRRGRRGRTGCRRDRTAESPAP